MGIKFLLGVATGLLHSISEQPYETKRLSMICCVTARFSTMVLMTLTSLGACFQTLALQYVGLEITQFDQIVDAPHGPE